jgi:alanyl-tRNA synthetase
MLSAKDIRSGFISFFEDQGHKFVPSSPVVPIDDPTLMFANAGMNQFKDVFLGTGSRDYKRAVNTQKCIRAGGKHNDLEDVGTDTYHHTFFEMLGNWSLGDYFKAEAIEWAWKLITEVWGIDQSKLYATVFAGDKEDGLEADDEAYKLWPKITSLPQERVLKFGRKDNFWEMGESGPCGPCSEIHIDLGPDRCDKKHVKGHKCAVNAGCSRFMELWNLVFIQFNRTADGRVVPLPAKHVDTGMGLERVASVLQKKSSNYDTDLFTPIMKAISDLSGKKYTSVLEDKNDIAFRVIADHLRCLTFAITDGGMPSNEGRGYVLRRILRRASRFGRVLDMHEPFIHKLVPVIVENMAGAFPELTSRGQLVSTVIEAEESSFGRTLDRGLQIFESAASKAQKQGNKTIAGDEAFQLYDTFGFPLDLTQLMARERNLSVDTAGFDTLMTEQKQRARAAKKDTGIALVTDEKLPTTDDSLKYQTQSCAAKVIGVIDKDGYKDAGEITEQAGDVALILDKTCFYAESGGQSGDCGMIKTDSGQFVVETTEKIADCVIHKGKVVSGKIKIGDAAVATTDSKRRSSMKNHTATHLLQWALQNVLGSTVAQQGSLVCPEYLRFDFTYPKAMTSAEVSQVEHLVREKIESAMPITTKSMPIKDAKKIGAMALFNEKYGDNVRVVAVGAKDAGKLNKAFSREFCGGTHVENTGEIEGFKIIKEESTAAGVRRITALTGSELVKYLEQRSDVIDGLMEMLKVPSEQIVERVEKLLADNKKLAKELKSRPKSAGVDPMEQAKQLLDSCEKVGDACIVVGSLGAVPADDARRAIDMLKKKAPSSAILIAVLEDDKVMLLSGVTDDLIKRGVKAGDIVKEIAPIIGGGGGGKPQMAQAGGKDASKLDECLEAARKYIASKLQ